MTVAFPWSGRDFNALVPMSGRAAVPNTPAGTGFNWPSLTGRISGYIRPVGRGGFRGLGQPAALGPVPEIMCPGDPSCPDSPALICPGDPSCPNYVSPADNAVLAAAANGASAASNQAPWWASILSNSLTTGLQVGSTISSYQLNPLYQKQTYYQTPQGAVYASNVGTPGIPGLTTSGSLMPLLLIGGGLMIFMMMGRR